MVWDELQYIFFQFMRDGSLLAWQFVTAVEVTFFFVSIFELLQRHVSSAARAEEVKGCMRVGEVFGGELLENDSLIILLWYLDSHAFLHSVLIDYVRNVPFAREKLVVTLARPLRLQAARK